MALLAPEDVTPAALDALRNDRRATRRRCAEPALCDRTAQQTTRFSAWWRATGRCTGRRSIRSSPTIRPRRSARAAGLAGSRGPGHDRADAQGREAARLHHLAVLRARQSRAAASSSSQVGRRHGGARAHQLARGQRRGDGVRRLLEDRDRPAEGRRADLGAEAAARRGDAAEHVRLVRREPAHQGPGHRFVATLRRQLQPRSALDLAQLRAGRVRRRADGRDPARGDLRPGIVGRACVGRHARRMASCAGATAGRPTTIRRKPRAGRNSRPGWRRCCGWIPSSSTAPR